MKLDSADESRLTLWFADAITKARVSEWGVYVDDDISLPDLSEGLESAFAKYLDRGGLVQLVESEAYRSLLTRGLEINDEDSSFLGATNLDAYGESKRLAERICELPIQYTIIARGPQAMSSATKHRDIDIRLSNRLRLISSSRIKGDFHLLTGNDKLDESTWRHNNIANKTLADKHLYFSFDASGYVSDRHSSHLIQEFLNELRSFYGACLAHDILYPFSMREGVSPLVMTFPKSDNILCNVSTLDTDLVQCTHFIGRKLGVRYNK